MAVETAHHRCHVRDEADEELAPWTDGACGHACKLAYFHLLHEVIEDGENAKAKVKPAVRERRAYGLMAHRHFHRMSLFDWDAGSLAGNAGCHNCSFCTGCRFRP